VLRGVPLQCQIGDVTQRGGAAPRPRVRTHSHAVGIRCRPHGPTAHVTLATTSSRIIGASSAWSGRVWALAVCQRPDEPWLATRHWRWSERDRFGTLAGATCALKPPSWRACSGSRP